ncbi:hypothetical protein K1719_014278 [Acacia pycnantha]|nr:hypothetical protein K1719_014278 [Acacia pycnantha]
MEKLPVIELLLHLVCLLLLVSSVMSSNGHLITCLPSDQEALLDFKTGLQDHANVLSSWREISNCCEWHGIECDNNTGAVITVDLHNPYSDPNNSNSSYGRYVFRNLSGNLSYLQVLDLGFLELYVDNFQWINGLISLEYLAMDGVNLSLVNKDWVAAFMNQLPSIVELHLSGCNLSSYNIQSPHAPLNFSSLAVIDLSFNSFHSKMPDWLVNISSLQHIVMSESGLFGKIPLGLGEMPNLLWLDLSRNYDLTATCSQLFRRRWEKIQVINLRENNLQGKLPFSLGNLTSLTRLYVDSNAIKGGIPSSIGRLCNLSRFSLSMNNMTGNLPEILEGTHTCSLKKPLHNLQYFVLSNNHLSGKIPYWFGHLENLVGLDLGIICLRDPSLLL